jgi:hypothetical protein
MHQFTLARWRANSNNRGLVAPTVTNYEPGTEPLGGGFDGIGAVKDQMIDQGIALSVSTEVEPTIAYFQGPQRVASEHNNITGSDVWGIFDFHLAKVINTLTGRKLTGLTILMKVFLPFLYMLCVSRILLNCYVVGSIDSMTNNSRTEYHREWQAKNRDKVNEYKRNFYWKNPEKFRKKSRDTWKKNKGSTTSGKLVDIDVIKFRSILGKMSGTTYFRLRYVIDYGSEQINKQLESESISVWKAYNLVLNDQKAYDLKLVVLALKKGGLDKISKKDAIRIMKQFTNLKPL